MVCGDLHKLVQNLPYQAFFVLYIQENLQHEPMVDKTCQQKTLEILITKQEEINVGTYPIRDVQQPLEYWHEILLQNLRERDGYRLKVCTSRRNAPQLQFYAFNV